MARRHRFTPGGYVYHVFNRGSRKGVLFERCEDYDAFVRLMEEAREKRPIRIPAYCLMKTHFHFLLWPRRDEDVPRFMKWLTSTHAMRFHRCRGSKGTGAVYQSRYVSKPIGDARHFFTALRYVERNAVQAGTVERAEEWRWCSAWVGDARDFFVADEGPFRRPANWLEILNDL
jgi:putative transposase